MRVFWHRPPPARGAHCLRSLGGWHRKSGAGDPWAGSRAAVAVGPTGTLGLAACLVFTVEGLRTDRRLPGSSRPPAPRASSREAGGSVRDKGPEDTEVPRDPLSTCQGRPSAGRGEGADSGRRRRRGERRDSYLRGQPARSGAPAAGLPRAGQLLSKGGPAPSLPIQASRAL